MSVLAPSLRRLLKEELPPHKKALVFVALTGLVYSASYAKLITMLDDIQKSLQSGQVSQYQMVAATTLGIALTVAVARYFHIYTMNVIAESIVNSVRLRLQRKFMRLNQGFHGNYESGSGGLMSRILNDVKVIQDGLRMVADIFREPLLAILLFANLLRINWRLTLTVIVVLPFILWFLRQISKSLRKYVLHSQDHLEKITSTVKESLDGVRIIQSFNLEKMMEGRLQGQSDEYLGLRRKIHSRIEVMGPVTEFVATCLVLGIFYYFSVDIVRGLAAPNDAINYIVCMIALNLPLKKFQESYVRIQETVVATNRVYSILDEASEVPTSSGFKPFPTQWQRIVFKHVDFSYGNSQILKDINLEIRRGEQIAFVGESGSGKSTLVNLLSRFYDPTAGEILIDDIPLKQIDLKDLRRHVAMVNQDVFLFSDTIARNIQAGDFDRTSGPFEEAARSANASDFIQRLPQSFQSRVGDRGNLLSGGEKQRISIARAIYKDAPILILDEATSALDSASEQEVQKGLDQLMKGRTSLVVAHRLSTVQNADRILVLKDGRVHEDGRHDQLLAKEGVYKRFWNLQTKV